MRTLMVWAALALIPHSTALADSYRSDGIDDFKSQEIEVQILDNATGGCWTNMESIKKSAELKLGELGLTVVSESPFKLLITVNATRLESRSIPRLVIRGSEEQPLQVGGKCYGNAEMAAYSIEEADILGALTVYGSHETIFTGFDNANQIAIDFVEAGMGLLK